MNLEYAKKRLEAWGDWARVWMTFGLSYPNCSPEHRMVFGQSSQHFEPDNPEAEEIDSIVRLMGDETRTLMIEYYIEGRSMIEIASFLRVSRNTVEKRMEGALGFVAGRLVGNVKIVRRQLEHPHFAE